MTMVLLNKPAARRVMPSGRKKHSNVHHPKTLPQVDQTFTGMSIAKAYNCPQGLAGSGIAIIEYGGGWNAADVAQSAQLQECPVPVITNVNAGLSNTPGGDADDEVSLDIQAAMGVLGYMTGAPAQIYMIWADSIDSAFAAISKLIDSGAKIGAVSQSWGSDEGDGSEQAQSASIQLFTQKYGIPFCVSSGDNDDGANSTVDVPADSPYAVGVSGTTKTSTQESVWNSGGGEGTGGGESNVFPMPAYQKGIIPPPASGSWRVTGDVAAIGDPNTGLQVVLNGQVSPIGGTSLAAPVIAAMIAGMGLPKLTWPDCLYAARTALNVVAVGNNNPSGSGNWPGPVCCGLGVPDGTKLYAALTGATPPSSPPIVPPTPTGGTFTGQLNRRTGAIAGSFTATSEQVGRIVGECPGEAATLSAQPPTFLSVTQTLIGYGVLPDRAGQIADTLFQYAKGDGIAAWFAIGLHLRAMRREQPDLSSTNLQLILQFLIAILPLILAAFGA